MGRWLKGITWKVLLIDFLYLCVCTVSRESFLCLRTANLRPFCGHSLDGGHATSRRSPWTIWRSFWAHWIHIQLSTTQQRVRQLSNWTPIDDWLSAFCCCSTGQDITLADLCLQVFEPSLSRRYRALATHLPSYSCLMLSPANIWRDSSRFRQDTDFLSTLLKFKDTTASPLPVGTLHNLFFGVHFDETGIRRSYGRNRQRTVTYAITIVLRHNVPAFIDGLREFLLSRFPPSGQYYHTERSHSKEEEFAGEEDVPYQASMETLHVFFHSTFTFAYLIPLFLFYASFCLYFYFSVRK